MGKHIVNLIPLELCKIIIRWDLVSGFKAWWTCPFDFTFCNTTSKGSTGTSFSNSSSLLLLLMCSNGKQQLVTSFLKLKEVRVTLLVAFYRLNALVKLTCLTSTILEDFKGL